MAALSRADQIQLLPGTSYPNRFKYEITVVEKNRSSSVHLGGTALSEQLRPDHPMG